MGCIAAIVLIIIAINFPLPTLAMIGVIWLFGLFDDWGRL